MNATLFVVVLCALIGTSGSTAVVCGADQSASLSPVAQQTAPAETVWVVFHVKRGQEANVKKLLTDSWAAYVRKSMVNRQPHIIAQGSEEGGEYFLELLSWKSSDVPDNADAEIRTLWKALEDQCEPRHGDSGIIFREIQLVAGTATDDIRVR
jgi:hypothetical protein